MECIISQPVSTPHPVICLQMELRSWEFRAKTAFTASPCRKELEEVLCSRALSSWVLSVAASPNDLGWEWGLGWIYVQMFLSQLFMAK